MGQNDSCPSRIPPPESAIKQLNDTLTILTPLYPNEALYHVDGIGGRIHLNLPADLAEDIWNNLPLHQSIAFSINHENAIMRLKDSHHLPIWGTRSPDPYYWCLLASVQSVLTRYGYKFGYSSEDKWRKPPQDSDSPPPPKTASSRKKQNPSADKSTACACNQGQSGPQKQRENTEEVAHGKATPTESNPHTPSSDLLPGVDPTTVFGYRDTIATKRAQLFESQLEIKFPNVVSILHAYGRSTPNDQPLAPLSLQRPFTSETSNPGFFATTARVVGNELFIWTSCRIRASTLAVLHSIFTSSVPETWLLPCRHLGSSSYHNLPLRNRRLTCAQFEEIFDDHMVYGSDESAGVANNPWASAKVISCEYCCTDYTIQTRTRSRYPDQKEGEDEFLLEVNVWHNLGDGREALEGKWLRIAAAAPFVTLTRPRPGFKTAQVMKSFYGESVKAHQRG